MLVEQRRRQSDEVRGLTAELDRLRRERAEQERALDSTRERARQAELGEAEAKLRLETTIETLRRELDIEPAVAEAAEMPELPEGASPAGRVRELDRELRLLGPINPLALEEFNELQGRHTFLEEQLEDVRTHASRPRPGDRRGRRGDPERVRLGVRRRQRELLPAVLAAVPGWHGQARRSPRRTTC